MENAVAKHLRELADKIESGAVGNVSANAQRFVDVDMQATEAANDGALRFNQSPHQVLLIAYSEGDSRLIMNGISAT